MAQLRWSNFLKAHPSFQRIDIRWHARNSATMTGKVPSPFAVLVQALRTELKGDWTIENRGVDFRIILADATEAFFVTDLFQSSKGPLDYREDHYLLLLQRYGGATTHPAQHPIAPPGAGTASMASTHLEAARQ